MSQINQEQQDFQPTTWSVICSVHFEKDCFEQKPKSRYLKAGSIPTLYLKPGEHSVKPQQQIQLEHDYRLPSQKELKRRLDIATNEIIKSKKKIKLHKQSFRRKTEKCETLAEVVRHLIRQRFVTETASDKLIELGAKVPAHLFQRLVISGQRKVLSRKKYSKELQCFALTLQFYSNRAYNYVRDTFQLNLPHENVVRRWYRAVQCETGIIF